MICFSVFIIKCKINSEILNPVIGLTIFDNEEKPVGTLVKYDGLKKVSKKEDNNFYYDICVTVPRINLSQGLYNLNLFISENTLTKPLLQVKSIQNFQIQSTIDIYPPIEFEADWSQIEE